MIFHGLLFTATGTIWAIPCTLIVGTTYLLSDSCLGGLGPGVYLSILVLVPVASGALNKGLGHLTVLLLDYKWTTKPLFTFGRGITL